MRRKKGTAVRIFLFVIMASCLSACAGGNRQEPSGELKEPSEGYEQINGNQDEKEPDSQSEDGSVSDKEIGKEDEEGAVSAPSVCGRLAVRGTQLVDEHGNAVQLKGISTHGIAWFPQYVNEELFRELRRDWKANVIRLAMYTAESGGYCTDGDKESLKALVKNGVKYAANQDMYVIIDWHILSDNNPNQYKKEALDFFDEMSEEFSDYDNVLYEICNEPNGSTSWDEIRTYAEEVIPVIRRNSPKSVILIGTPNWSQQVDAAAAAPITGYDNLMYTLHFYAATHTGYLRDVLSAAVDAGLPVFVSEFGICDASGSGEIDKVQAKAWMQLLKQYNISSVAWNLSNKDETSAVILSTVDKTSGFSKEDLSAFGRWLYEILSGGLTEEPSENNVVSGGFRVSERNNGLEITATPSGSWESGGQHFFQYVLNIKNVSRKVCYSWSADIEFGGAFFLSDGWNGNYKVEGDTLHISSADYNGELAAGGSTNDVGFIVSGESGLRIQSIR